MDNLDSIFSVQAVEMVKAPKAESVFYNIGADKGTDKVYTSQVKFLPNIFNTKNSSRKVVRMA